MEPVAITTAQNGQPDPPPPSSPSFIFATTSSFTVDLNANSVYRSLSLLLKRFTISNLNMSAVTKKASGTKKAASKPTGSAGVSYEVSALPSKYVVPHAGQSKMVDGAPSRTFALV